MNKKLLAITGDSSATVTAQQATITTKLWEIITGNVVETVTANSDIDKTYVVSGTTVTLDPAPASGEAISIFTVDADGRDETKLTIGSPSTTPTAYSITGSVITVHSTLGGKKIHVYYKTAKTVTKVTSKPNLAMNYRIVADMLCKDVETKEAFIAQLVIPNGKIQEQFSLSTANNADEPSPIPLAIDCLEDSVTGAFYQILFADDIQ